MRSSRGATNAAGTRSVGSAGRSRPSTGVAWRIDDHTERPHPALGQLTPEAWMTTRERLLEAVELIYRSPYTVDTRHKT
jgi:hypothetical protein